MDNIIHPSGVQTENDSQIHQPVEVKSINDLIVKVWYLETNQPYYFKINVMKIVTDINAVI
jgi:hypothetical protein